MVFLEEAGSSGRAGGDIGRSISEELASDLRRKILDGELVSGQRLVETDLISEYRVSRSAIREAFKSLESTGLVEIRRQRGAAVARLTRHDIEQLFEVRERLEGFAASLAASNSSEPGNEHWLRAQIDVWSDDSLIRAERLHMQHNVILHEGLVKMSENRFLWDALQRLQIPAYRQKFVSVIGDDQRRKSAEEHIGILKAVLAGDVDAAERLVREHVRHTAQAALAVGESE
jgi:DNA-binding GntR family transcriptional regulator